MKNYDEKEKFRAYITLTLLWVAIFLVCYSVEYLGVGVFVDIIFLSTVVFFTIIGTRKFCRYIQPNNNWIWWCSTCGKEVPNNEINGEGIHINCGCEATYKIKK